MGDRANIAIKTGPEPRDHVWIYSHNYGHSLPDILRQALDSEMARGRWHDASYLARILIGQIVPAGPGCAVGWGISHYMADNDGYPVLEVDVDAQTVRMRPLRNERWDVDWDAQPVASWNFADFCALNRAEWL